MNARTLRRAIERKQARKAQKERSRQQQAANLLSTAAETSNAEYEGAKASLLQLQANRRNAELSTGPKTEAGKAISSRNALKTGLTGRTVLLPNEDAHHYEQHIKSVFNQFGPSGDRETELVQAIADSRWRLARIPSLESGLYALGRIQFAEEFQHLPASEADVIVTAKTFLAFQRQLNNLSIQEGRLRRQIEKDTAELADLQQYRAAAQRLVSQNAPAKTACNPKTTAIGFEFTTQPHELIASTISPVSGPPGGEKSGQVTA